MQKDSLEQDNDFLFTDCLFAVTVTCSSHLTYQMQWKKYLLCITPQFPRNALY